MNILIDTSPLRNQSSVRGIGRYTNELVKSLQNLGTEHKFFVSVDRPTHIDLIHYPFFDLFLPTLPFKRSARTVVTIHDLTPLVLRGHYPRGLRGQLKLWRQCLAVRGVAHIITDSNCSKRDIVERLRFKSDLVTSIPLAASAAFQKQPTSVVESVRRKYQMPKNYVLYVGDISYNKNLPFLIGVVAKIPDITLILVGKALSQTSIPEGKAIADAIRMAGSAKYVKLIDNVESESDLIAIYSGAQVYVQPSLYEGFGLPVIEAMRCRVPVVSSCGGSLGDLVGEAGYQFNPLDPKSCESQIRRVLRQSDEERQKMTKKAHEYSEQFTWERTARETLQVYEKVMKR